jgi:hypothetical protein
MSKTHKYGNVQESLLKIHKLKDFDFCLQVEPDLKITLVAEFLVDY